MIEYNIYEIHEMNFNTWDENREDYSSEQAEKTNNEEGKEEIKHLWREYIGLENFHKFIWISYSGYKPPKVKT